MHLRRRFETLATTVDDTSLVFAAHVWSKERSTCMVMAYIGTAYILMTYIFMAYIVMVCTVMAYIVMSWHVWSKERSACTHRMPDTG